MPDRGAIEPHERSPKRYLGSAFHLGAGQIVRGRAR
jgi:hypothetical protein